MAIGRTNAGGGGTSLNFKVVGGTTQPTSPKENTIRVNTDIDIPFWVFSATEPEDPMDGILWFSIGTSSPAEVNALRKNTIQMFLLSARQYFLEQWVVVEAELYQGGEWITLGKYLHNNERCATIGGGWLNRRVAYDGSYMPSVPMETSAAGNLIFSMYAPNTSGIVYKEEKIDLTGISTVTFEGAAIGSNSRLYIWSDIGQYQTTNAVLDRAIPPYDITVSINVSTLEGEYYIGFGLRRPETGNTPSQVILSKLRLD